MNSANLTMSMFNDGPVWSLNSFVFLLSPIVLACNKSCAWFTDSQPNYLANAVTWVGVGNMAALICVRLDVIWVEVFIVWTDLAVFFSMNLVKASLDSVLDQCRLLGSKSVTL